MPETYIIDAYNVAHALTGSGPGGAKDLPLHEVRRALEWTLRAFRRASGPGVRIYLVYDGEMQAGGGGQAEKGFEVYFARPPKKADDVVLDLARRLEGDSHLCVVTSDVTDIARHLGGLRVKHLTREAFAALVAKRLGRARGSLEADPDAKPERVSPQDVDHWVREFGFEAGDPEP